MDYSPRSSKRRKLDTPTHTAPSASAKRSAKRSSGRLAGRPVSYVEATGLSDVEEEPAPPKPRGRRAEASTNRSPAQQAAADDLDIYDDIDGALGIQTSPRPTPRRLQPGPKHDNAKPGETREGLGHVVATPKRGRGRPRKDAASASRSVLRTVAGSNTNGAVDKQGDELADELADESTWSKHAKGNAPAAASAPKTTAPRPGGRKKKVPTAASEHDAETVHGKSPSKHTASARRRNNRADHVHNRSDEGSPAHDEHVEHVDGHDGDALEDDVDVDGNSILGSVLDPTEPSPFNKLVSAQKEKTAPPLIYQGLATGRELDLLKTILLERITGKRPSPLAGLDEEYKLVHQLVEHTITAGEGNSMLLIGARGSGKTALMNKVLADVSRQNGGDYHVVRLNGLIHTDDKIALREIWRQLGKEMDIEEDGSGPGKNYADTLTTLLALLSHPSEHTGELTEQVAKAVIFVMDEFDLFAQHPRQTLLYNLFDIAQSRKAPIAVLGLTTRIDVTNSLEKRVKSRFSHRYVHLSLAKTFTAFQETCKACLTVQPDQLSVEERGILQGGMKITPTKKGKKTVKQHVLEEWNANIEELFASPSFLKTYIAPSFYRTKSIPSVLTTFFLPIVSLSPNSALEPLNLLNPPDAKLSLIPQISTLALSLLIATARLDIIHDSDTCNFNMAYDEYVTLASKARIQSAAGGLSASGSVSKVWGKDVARKEWESLVELGLVMPVIAGQIGEFGMVRADVSLEEIGDVLKVEKERGLERWCRAI